MRRSPRPTNYCRIHSNLVTPPRIHKHRYCGVLAPNAKLRRAVIESAGPAGSIQLRLDQAREKMGLDTTESEQNVDLSPLRKAAARCWALLLVRIYECLPLLCTRCGKPMRIIAFIQDPLVIERILESIGEPAQAPEVLPARGPPQAELDLDPGAESDDWPEMDQRAGPTDDGWD